MIALASLALIGSVEASALTLDTGDSDVKVRWDNTLKYTAGWRVASPNEYVANGLGLQPNTDYGDLSHGKGLINNRVDLLSELDVVRNNLGFRVSAAGWYDAHYTKDTNDFSSQYAAGVPNNQAGLAGVPSNRNSQAVKDLMGRKAELLDAFLFGSFDLGQESKATVRVGKHTQLYGETLFLGANGIAAAQGPVDLIKAFSLPNAQFKEIAMPVGQVSTDIQLSPDLSVGAYYQYDWKGFRLPASGSYFSAADFVGAGGDLLLTPGGPSLRSADREGKKSFGARVKFRHGDTDYGLYAARFDSFAPIPVADLVNGTYSQQYARNIHTYGASASTVVGETNLAVEASVRRNTPLSPLGDLVLTVDSTTDNLRHTAYARGNSFHMNLSAITVMPATALWDGAAFVGELAYNRLLKVTHNPTVPVSALNTTHSRDAAAFRLVFTPEYFQVMPGVDLQVQIGLGYGLFGRSAIFQVSPEHGGDFSVGVNADFNKTWKAGLNYTNYFGRGGPAPSLDPASSSYASYKQYYADRDFITFTVQRTF